MYSTLCSQLLHFSVVNCRHALLLLFIFCAIPLLCIRTMLLLYVQIGVLQCLSNPSERPPEMCSEFRRQELDASALCCFRSPTAPLHSSPWAPDVFLVTFSLAPLSCATWWYPLWLIFFSWISNTVLLACTSCSSCVDLVSMWTTISGNSPVFFRISFAFLVTQIFKNFLNMKGNHTDDSNMTVIFLCHLPFFFCFFLFMIHCHQQEVSLTLPHCFWVSGL